MSFLDNYAETKIINSIDDESLEYIENSIFRFDVPSSVVIRRTLGEGLIGLDLAREFFELHLYNRITNELIKSVAIPFSEGYLYIRDGGSERNLQLGLTFWAGDPLSPEERSETLVEKYLSDVPLGEYNVFVNLFSDELGSYNDSRWQIKQVSNSRREIILEPTDIENFDEVEYKQFASDSIFNTDFDILIDKLFQKGTPEEYDRMTEEFFDRLVGRENDLINDDNREVVIDALSEIFREVFQKIKDYSDDEVNGRRYRIVQEDFDNFIRDTVLEVVQRRVDLFPDPRVTFLAK